jgi:DNA mismatch repair protein MutS
VKEIPKNNFQLSIFEPADPRMEELKEKLTLVDVNTLSPIEALLKLNEFQKIMKN